MSDARDVMRETLMNARQCRKACYEVRSCDCAQDVVKILAALAEAGLKVVAREPTPEMYKASLHEATGINTPHWGPWERMWDAAEPKTVGEGSE